MIITYGSIPILSFPDGHLFSMERYKVLHLPYNPSDNVREDNSLPGHVVLRKYDPQNIPPLFGIITATIREKGVQMSPGPQAMVAASFLLSILQNVPVSEVRGGISGLFFNEIPQVRAIPSGYVCEGRFTYRGIYTH